MNYLRVVLATLTAGLLGGAVRAGVYNLDDPLPQHLPPLPYLHEQIQLVLGPLRKAALAPVANQPGPYEVQAAELEHKEAADLTTTDRVNLGACYLRMNRPNDALRVLRAADQNHFLVRANLAATYQALNELGQAVAYEGQALAAWPSIQPGWNSAELGWYRRVEGYYLKLLLFRQAERDANERLYNQPNRPWDKMDLLFEKPRAGAGDYQAQEQPWKLWGDLPPDAYAVVSQLLVWFPNDDRLYWQLGEILNSIGLVPEAVKVFDELSNKNLNGVREFKEHRRVLKESVGVADALTAAYGNDAARFQRDFRLLMAEISPPGLLLPPGGGGLANATGLAVLLQADASTARAAGPPAPPAARGWQFDWKQLFVGFAAGLIVAVLAALQWMEWRRRGRVPRAMLFRPDPRSQWSMTPEPSVAATPLPIGWKERLDFPDWGLKRVRVKIDTGACTSALGASGYELVEADGLLIVRLRLALNRRRPEKTAVIETPLLRMVYVTNTGGGREERPMIEATIRLGPVRKRIRLTVTSRAAMRFPMLLGREALAGSFVVDVSRKDILKS